MDVLPTSHSGEGNMEQPKGQKKERARGPRAGAAAVDSLVAALRSEDGMAREHARSALVALGDAAATPLIGLLADDDEQVRWEAAKALSEIRDPRAAEPLVGALVDERSGTRWLAAEGLIALGRAGLLPLLRRLATGSPSARLREGAHHVLRQLAEKEFARAVAPVIAELEGYDPSTLVAPAAQGALAALEGQSHDAR
jgi:HEAT repeat protein